MQFHRVDEFLLRSECGRYRIETTYGPEGVTCFAKRGERILGYARDENAAMAICRRDAEGKR